MKRQPEHGPGVQWLAARTEKDPDQLVCSPRAALAALNDAVREAAHLAARGESEDPDVRAAAQKEIAALQQELAAHPTPGDVALSRIAEGLRDLANRLRRDDT
jgi:hypothetical protein